MSGEQTVEFGGAFPFRTEIPGHHVVPADDVTLGGVAGLVFGIALQFTARAGVPAFRVPMFTQGRPGLAVGVAYGVVFTVAGANAGYWLSSMRRGAHHH